MKRESKWYTWKKIHQTTNEGSIGGAEEEKRWHIENKLHNGRKKPFISNHLKCKVKLINRKTDIGKIDFKKTWFNNMMLKKDSV